MIEAAGLVKRFGAVEALRGVSFRAEDGRITGLLGPNGAGKSTTLRMFCATLRPDAGEARIDGETVEPGHDRRASPPWRAASLRRPLSAADRAREHRRTSAGSQASRVRHRERAPTR